MMLMVMAMAMAMVIMMSMILCYDGEQQAFEGNGDYDADGGDVDDIGGDGELDNDEAGDTVISMTVKMMVTVSIMLIRTCSDGGDDDYDDADDAADVGVNGVVNDRRLFSCCPQNSTCDTTLHLRRASRSHAKTGSQGVGPWRIYQKW